MFELKQDNTSLRVDFSGRSAEIHIAQEKNGVSVAAHARLDDLPPGLLNELHIIDSAINGEREFDEFHKLRAAYMLGRVDFALTNYLNQPLKQVAEWILRSRETTNFTYPITNRCKGHIANAVATITGCSVSKAREMVNEPQGDKALLNHIRKAVTKSRLRHQTDEQAHFGRRLLWYALVRITAPALVVETGVDKGLGALLMCAALRRNNAENKPGRYLGVDIDPNAGSLFGGELADCGEIVCGDAIDTISHLTQPIGVYICDSDHDPKYEAREYEALRGHMQSGGIIIADNAHVSDALMEFAEGVGLSFLFVSEQPKDHFYRGAGAGVAFSPCPQDNNCRTAILRREIVEMREHNCNLNEFVHRAAHDLTSPNRTVAMYAEILAKRLGVDDNQINTYLDAIATAAQRGRGLVDELLNYATMGMATLKPTAVELRPLLDQLAEELREESRAHMLTVADEAPTTGVLELTIRPHADHDTACTVWAAPSQLRQALWNILHNAMLYRHPDKVARIEITFGHKHGDGNDELAMPTTEISISDNGIGFEPTFADRIFAPLERLVAGGDYPGYGLGLAIAKRIIEDHGGSISAVSTPHKGTTVTILFPDKRDDDPEQTKADLPCE